MDTTSGTTGTGGGLALGGYYNGTSDIVYHFGNIQGIKENSTAGNYAGAMIFSTRQQGGTPLEKMRITSDGAVVLQPNGITTGLRLQGRSSDNNFYIQWKSNDGGTTYGSIGTDSANTSLQYNTDIHDFNSASSSVNFLELKSTGAVFNEGGANADFRVESDANSNAIFLDAGQDVVSLGAATINGAFVDNQYVGLQIGTPGVDNFGGHMFMSQTAATDTWMDIIATHDDNATGVYFTIHGVRTGDQNRSYVAFVRYAYSNAFNLMQVSQQNCTVEFRTSGDVLQYRFTSAGPYFVNLSILSAG